MWLTWDNRPGIRGEARHSNRDRASLSRRATGPLLRVKARDQYLLSWGGADLKTSEKVKGSALESRRLVSKFGLELFYLLANRFAGFLTAHYLN
jgi:hypothetical protein